MKPLAENPNLRLLQIANSCSAARVRNSIVLSIVVAHVAKEYH